MLRASICHDPGLKMAISARRGDDDAAFDFADGAYKSDPPKSPTLDMVEGTGIYAGRYRAEYGPTPRTIWWRGPHIITFHELGPNPRAIKEFVTEFADGENTFFFPLLPN